MFLVKLTSAVVATLVVLLVAGRRWAELVT
jgi:hypothetical protein